MTHINVAHIEERVKALELYQEKQNGALRRIDDRIEKMYWQLVAVLISIAVMLAGQVFALSMLLRR